MNNSSMVTQNQLQQLQALLQNQGQLGGGLNFGSSIDPLLGQSLSNDYLKTTPPTPSWAHGDLGFEQSFRNNDTLAQLNLQQGIASVKEEGVGYTNKGNKRSRSDSEGPEMDEIKGVRGGGKMAMPSSMKEKNREAQRRFRERQKSQITELNQQNSQLHSDVRKYQSQIEVLKQQVEQSKALKQQVEEELGAIKATYEEKLSDKEQLLVEKDQQIQQLRQQLQQYEY